MQPRSVLASAGMRPPAKKDFIVRPLAALGVDLDPFLMIDWGRMATDPFGPHPHAGFSAVTWLLPHSEGSVRNRDSLGDDSVFPPGSIHWFEAAHGAVHNETPIGTVELFQIFVNLPLVHKHGAPKTYRATPADIPVVDVGAGSVRVVVGAFEGRVSPVVPRTPDLGILHLELDGTLAIPLPRDHNAVLVGSVGNVSVDGVDDDNVVAFNKDGDGIVVRGRGHATLLHGKPLGEPVVAHGPFVMGSRADLFDAVARYQRWQMGRVDPLD